MPGVSVSQEDETATHGIETDGFEFVEYAAPDPKALADLFVKMGFSPVAKHRSKDVILFRQGDINFIINAEPASFAQRFARLHGPSICAMAFRAKDAAQAYRRAVASGAWGFEGEIGPMELNIPAIKGVGDSLLYLVDRYGPGGSIYDVDFKPIPGAESNPRGAGLTTIDHLTHNVYRGRMAEWAEFYEKIFGFREIRYFDIKGKATGLKSKAMTSRCGKIRIPLNESADDKSQIAEYLSAYHGEGIQHVALTAGSIHDAVEKLKSNGVPFQDTPDTYYDLVGGRLPGIDLDVECLKRDRILVDGGAEQGGGLLLQIFTETVIGPIFFEIIERQGNEGFGEGNFKALFESIELDQIRRGVLKAS